MEISPTSSPLKCMQIQTQMIISIYLLLRKTDKTNKAWLPWLTESTLSRSYYYSYLFHSLCLCSCPDNFSALAATCWVSFSALYICWSMWFSLARGILAKERQAGDQRCLHSWAVFHVLHIAMTLHAVACQLVQGEQHVQQTCIQAGLKANPSWALCVPTDLQPTCRCESKNKSMLLKPLDFHVVYFTLRLWHSLTTNQWGRISALCTNSSSQRI